MKRYEDMTYEEQEEFKDWAEAEYCPKCGGKGYFWHWIFGHQDDPGRKEVCERCKGTGRA